MFILVIVYVKFKNLKWEKYYKTIHFDIIL